MIVQQLDPAYWLDWNEDIINNAENDLKPILDEVINRFDKGGCIVSECYGVCHNNDETTVWDQDKMKNITVTKPKHVHILVKFERGNTLNNLAVMVGVEPQYLERAKSGRYGWDNCLSYAIHAKNPEKHQYSPEEVVTALGEDYLSVYNRRMETWIRGRATKEAKETNLSVDFLISEIIQGKIDKNTILLTDSYYRAYALNKRLFNDAFDTAAERKSYQTILDLANGKFKRSVIFISGSSGKGKTRFSKQIIKLLQKISKEYTGKVFDYCLTASTNAFDEYASQDILLLDDFRGQSLETSNWLKLLDNFSISPISARYHNKSGCAKVTLITSVKPVKDFFMIVKESSGEDLGQFFRRVDYLIEIVDDDEFIISKSVKNKNFVDDGHAIPFVTRPSSYEFEELDKFTKDGALEMIGNLVITNMQWDKEASTAKKNEEETIETSKTGE